MERESVQSSSKVIAFLSLSQSLFFYLSCLQFLPAMFFMSFLSFSCLYLHLGWKKKTGMSSHTVSKYDILTGYFLLPYLGKSHAWVPVYLFRFVFRWNTYHFDVSTNIYVKRKVSSDCLWTQLRCTAMSHGSVRRQKVFHKYPKLNKIINVTNSYLWGQFPCLSLWEPPLLKLLFFLHETKTVSGYLFVIPNSHVGGLRYRWCLIMK